MATTTDQKLSAPKPLSMIWTNAYSNVLKMNINGTQEFGSRTANRWRMYVS